MINELVHWLQGLGSGIRFADIVDIVLTSFFIYLCLLWFKMRVSRSFVLAFGVLSGVYILAKALNMRVTSELFQAGFIVIVVALVVIFNLDIRRVFEHIIAWNPLKKNKEPQGMLRIAEIMVKTTQFFSKNRIGALFVFVGKENIEPYTNGGTLLNGEISFPILSSIFDTSSTGHDGAVMIVKNKIEKFGVHLPASENILELRGAGTRHAAALGLSERCDSLIIVVSEERGSVSIAQKGRLIIVSEMDAVRSYLLSFFRELFPPIERKHYLRLITSQIWLKVLAFCTALIIWLSIGYRADSIVRTYTVPFEIRNLSEEWMVQDIKPTTIRVSLSGAERDFTFDPASLVVSLDFSNIKEGTHVIPVMPENFNCPSRLSVRQMQPQEIECVANQLILKQLPVKLSMYDSVPFGKKLISSEIDPSIVPLFVRKSLKFSPQEIKTEPIDLSKYDRSIAFRAKLITPEFCRIPSDAAGAVIVRLTINQN